MLAKPRSKTAELFYDDYINVWLALYMHFMLGFEHTRSASLAMEEVRRSMRGQLLLSYSARYGDSDLKRFCPDVRDAIAQVDALVSELNEKFELMPSEDFLASFLQVVAIINPRQLCVVEADLKAHGLLHGVWLRGVT